MLKKAVQQGRSEQRGESYSVPYVEPLSEARTPLADFFRILLVLVQCDLHRRGHNDSVLSLQGFRDENRNDLNLGDSEFA